jgi:hypothetical protein
MAKPIDIETLEREEIIAMYLRLKYRHKAMIFFLKAMGIWDEYRQWVSLKSSQIGD